MKRRRSVHHTGMSFVFFCLCVFGSTKSGNAFDFSNSTNRKQEIKEVVVPLERTTPVGVLSIPPLPRNKHGQLTCTKNRYVKNESQIGVVSWYGNEFHGRLTANGERFDQNANTLAHLSLPMGTNVLVKNPETGKIVKARVNDCGPYKDGRIADLSRGLAEQLGISKRGVGTVVITVL